MGVQLKAAVNLFYFPFGSLREVQGVLHQHGGRLNSIKSRHRKKPDHLLTDDLAMFPWKGWGRSLDTGWVESQNTCREVHHGVRWGNPTQWRCSGNYSSPESGQKQQMLNKISTKNLLGIKTPEKNHLGWEVRQKGHVSVHKPWFHSAYVKNTSNIYS